MMGKDTEDTRYKDWSQELKEFQTSDLDQREQARESDRFLLDKDGQWEDSVAQALDSQQRPRYTFDKITPVIESIMAEIEDMEFGCNVKPEGNVSNKETAETYEGMIRGIQNMSNTEHLYRHVGRRVVRRGFDAVIVKNKFKDEWSFEQDLFVESIPNAVNRVWVSNTCTDAASADSDVAYVLSSLSPAAYKEQYPEGSGVSVDDADLYDNMDDYSPEVVTIAERYYKKKGAKIEVAQLTNGDVVALDEKWDAIKDEQAEEGIKIAKGPDGKDRIKKVDDFNWYHCVFDGGGILTDERVTVFKTNPVVTFYGNFELLGQNSKITYSGITLKEMDAQRVHNYAKSREIEEGALAPRTKYWMTKKQAKGHENQISRMNVSSDPVQFFNPDSELPGYPQQSQAAQVNPNLANLSNQMADDIRVQASVTPAMDGQFQGRMSEDAMRQQVDRGTGATRKWVNSLVYGIDRICNILIETIPVVYDTKRRFNILGADGTEEVVTLNREVWDVEGEKFITMNNLNAGKYRVTASAGQAFSNRMEAGLSAMLEYAAIDPSIVQQGGDLMLKAIDAPLVDEMAARKREQLLKAGMIPEDQLTDEEKAKMEQAAQQPQPEDPMMVAAQAELMKGQADMAEAENKKASIHVDFINAETKRMELGLKQQDGQVRTAKTASDIQYQQIDTEGKVLDNQGKQIANVAARQELVDDTLRRRLADMDTMALINLSGTM